MRQAHFPSDNDMRHGRFLNSTRDLGTPPSRPPIVASRSVGHMVGSNSSSMLMLTNTFLFLLVLEEVTESYLELTVLY